MDQTADEEDEEEADTAYHAQQLPTRPPDMAYKTTTDQIIPIHSNEPGGPIRACLGAHARYGPIWAVMGRAEHPHSLR